MMGWECPKCGNVYGPNIQCCTNCNKNNYEWTCEIRDPNTGNAGSYRPLNQKGSG